MTAKKTPAKKATKKTTKKAAPKAAVPMSTSIVPAMTADLATRDEAIAALMHSLNKPDRKVIAHAHEVPNTYMLRRPTGIIEMDIDLGGGWPAGGCCMISGPDNSGKTWLLLKTMAEQQRIYGNACRVGYGMSEGQFPFDQAINAGVKVAVPDEIIDQWNQWRAIRGIPPYTDEEVAQFKEQIGEVHIFRGATGEELLSILLGAVNTKAYSVLGCDSINGLLPNADAMKDLDKANKKAAHAYMIDNFFRHYIPMTTGLNGANTTTLLFTQQVRANQERAMAPSHMQAYIKPWAVAGAYAAKHYKLIDMVISDRPLKKGDREDRHVVGKVVNWFLDKGKAGTHDNKSGEVAYYYNLPGTDDVGELIASAIKRAVIQQHGSKWVVVRPDTREIIEDFTAPSQKALRKMLEVDESFKRALRLEVLTAAGIRCLYE